MARKLLQAAVVRVLVPSRSRSSSQRGFTLIELMVAVVIVAILAAIAIVSYSRHIKSSRLVEARAFVATIQAREEAYRQQYGLYYDVSGGDTYYPALGADEPVAKQWSTPLPAGWAAIGARPESGVSYFEFVVRASAGPAHALVSDAANLGIPDPKATNVIAPWYYVVGRADMDGSGPTCGGFPYADCTALSTTSVAGDIVIRNEGK